MAEFAELDDNNMVLNVFGVSDEVLIGENGLSDEQLGIDWLNTYIKHSKYIQSFSDGSRRRQPAVRHGLYNEENDVFIDMKPPWNPSFTLVDGKWINLILKPDNYTVDNWPTEHGEYTEAHTFVWDEESVSWVLYIFPKPPEDEPQP